MFRILENGQLDPSDTKNGRYLHQGSLPVSDFLNSKPLNILLNPNSTVYLSYIKISLGCESYDHDPFEG